jgi:hypothetical protein
MVNLFFYFLTTLENKKYKGFQGNLFPWRVWAEPEVLFIGPALGKKTETPKRADANPKISQKHALYAPEKNI